MPVFKKCKKIENKLTPQKKKSSLTFNYKFRKEFRVNNFHKRKYWAFILFNFLRSWVQHIMPVSWKNKKKI